MAGYSGTPLGKKLGIKADHLVGLVNAPGDFREALADLPEGVELFYGQDGPKLLDVIVFFTKSKAELSKEFKALAKRMSPAAGLWIAWPKRSSGVATDLTENMVRAIGLEAGLVDNKVCAIDAIWSGLRFVIRIKDRPKK